MTDDNTDTNETLCMTLTYIILSDREAAITKTNLNV